MVMLAVQAGWGIAEAALASKATIVIVFERDIDDDGLAL